MIPRAAIAILAALTLTSLLAFAWMLRQFSLASAGLADTEEIEAQLQRSLDDQKKLARLDPASAALDRQRFDSIAALRQHLRVVELNRRELVREAELVLLAAVGVIVACGAALVLVERRRREARLVTRLRYLEHLSAWQEAARRHAHEIRTPLTAARMEVERFAATVERRVPEMTPEIAQARDSILEEIDHLREFTRGFTSFATIAKPRLRELDLGRFLDDFASTFAAAWPGMTLAVTPPAARRPPLAIADPDMLRQVLVNLATNSAHAGAHTVSLDVRRNGSAFFVDVADDGSGVAPEIRPRLFEPYTTSRGIGEGMGLGLAISKKILLDHGGDLDLADSSPRGTTFRLTIPAVPS